MSMVSHDVMVVQRVKKLLAARCSLIQQRARLASLVPDWVAEALQLTGMSKAELSTSVSDSIADDEARLAAVERAIIKLDHDIARAEDQLLALRHHSIDSIELVLECVRRRVEAGALPKRAAERYPIDDEWMLRVLERVSEDLQKLAAAEKCLAS